MVIIYNIIWETSETKIDKVNPLSPRSDKHLDSPYSIH